MFRFRQRSPWIDEISKRLIDSSTVCLDWNGGYGTAVEVAHIFSGSSLRYNFAIGNSSYRPNIRVGVIGIKLFQSEKYPGNIFTSF